MTSFDVRSPGKERRVIRVLRPADFRPVACWTSVLLSVAAVTHAEDPQTVRPSAAQTVTQQTTIKTERYLGVVTEPTPDFLAAQLVDVLPPERGLLVKRVLTDSPAEKAGIEPFDVLVSANSRPLATSDELKKLVTLSADESPIRLQLIRGAKVQFVDVLPAERTLSRMIHRHYAPVAPSVDGTASYWFSPGATNDQPDERRPAYSVSVQTRDGREFQAEIRLSDDLNEPVVRKLSGSAAEIAARTKSLPENVQRSVLRQLARLSEDRQTLRTVQFRFQPQRDGRRQILAVTLRRPQADGVVKSFELQQPMGEPGQPLPLQKLLQVPEFAAQLEELDPAVRENIESTLNTAALPGGTLRVESSQ